MVDLKLVHEYTKNLHILYVEDNQALRESTLKVLENFFKQVDTANDGAQGLEAFNDFKEKQSIPYDLVITDINMPHMNGVEMSKNMLEREPTQSVIFITAHNEPEFLHQAISIGVSSFLLKPLNLQDLATVLFKVCRSIADRKLVEDHYTMMEDMNQQLENHNIALEKKNKEQEKLIRILDTMMAVKANGHTENTTEEKTLVVAMDTDANANEKEDSYHEQISQLIEEDIVELQEIHQALDADIISIISGREEDISNLSALFSRYASILSMYSSFESLATTMSSLSQAMTESPLPRNEDNTQEIFAFLETFMYILGKWQEDILGEDESKSKQLDVSIIGDLETITNLWLAEKEGEEVEFF